MKPSSPSRSAIYGSPVFKDIVWRVASNTRRLREAKGWTQLQAAVRCGLSTPVYQIVENAGRNVTATTLARLCEGFAVDPQEFLVPAPPPLRRNPGRPKKVVGAKPT